MPTVWSDAHSLAVIHDVTENHSTRMYNIRGLSRFQGGYPDRWVAALVFCFAGQKPCGHHKDRGDNISQLTQNVHISIIVSNAINKTS